MLHPTNTVLAFFAHPDDETLAAGATIKKFTEQGIRVHVAVPNTGIHSRRTTVDEATRAKQRLQLNDDCYQALSLLGVRREDVYLGEFSDNEIDKHTLLELIHWLEAIIAKVKPDLVLTHHRYCTNIDHQYCHEAAVVATRPGVGLHIPLWCGEVPSSTGYLKPTQWEPNLFVDVTAAQVEAKIASMQAYKDEARPDPHPRSPEVLRALAKVRGSESGFFFAEAFMINKTYC